MRFGTVDNNRPGMKAMMMISMASITRLTSECEFSSYLYLSNLQTQEQGC